MLLRMARIDPDPADSIVSGAKWTLKERVGALFEDKAGLLLFRSSLVITAQASDRAKAGELVRDLLDRLLRSWREEDLKEEKKAEAEAMGVLVGQMRRLLSVASVRAQAECLLSKLRQAGGGVGAANKRRGYAVREEGRWAREREAVMVGRRQGRKVVRQGMFLLD